VTFRSRIEFANPFRPFKFLSLRLDCYITHFSYQHFALSSILKFLRKNPHLSISCHQTRAREYSPGKFIKSFATKQNFEFPSSKTMKVARIYEKLTFLRERRTKFSYDIFMLPQIWKRPGLNFINVLHTAFTLTEPKSVKKAVKSSVFLRFWDLQA